MTETLFVDALLFKDAASNPLNQPLDRPSDSRPVYDNAAPLTWPNATRMTLVDYNAYTVSHKAEWDAWDVAYVASLDAAAAAIAQAAKDAANPEYVTLRDQANAALTFNDSATTANTSYLAISSPTNAQVAAQVKTLTQQMDNVLAENTKMINAWKILVKEKLTP